MAIVLQVKEYCSHCLDFEPDVVKPEKITGYTTEATPAWSYQTDTIVRCEYAKRCENIRRYLEKQSSKES